MGHGCLGSVYILVVVDYFTKWVEVEAVKGIKTKDVMSFIWKDIITRYKVIMSMVFDNDPQFETPNLKNWLGDQGISHCSAGRPQANSHVKAFNILISYGIRKKIESRGSEELIHVL